MTADTAARFVAALHDKFHDGDPHAAAKWPEADNVAALRAVYAAIGAGDYAAVVAAMTDDAELVIAGPPGFPFAGRWRGRDEVLQALGRNFALVEDQEPEVVSLTAQGDAVVVVFRETGRWVATGRAYETHGTQAFRFRDGRIAHVRQILDTSSLGAAM